MNRSLILTATVSAITWLGTTNATAQFARVCPVPQQIETSVAAMVNQPTQWALRCDKQRLSSAALKALTEGTTHIAQNKKAPFTVTMGVVGDRCLRAFDKPTALKAEGYLLKVNEKGIVIIGADERGLYYGVQTLLQSMEGGKMQYGTVTDWPDTPVRGTVEGFYGTPWSHEARLSQIAFYGRHKMNTYIYGPKDDLYHRRFWRKPYPKAEAERIQQLCNYAKAHAVDFCWAIHPGVDIRWDKADRDSLVAKLEDMYTLGVRSFAVFFDDITGEGTRPDRQAQLLNDVEHNFRKKHNDVAPLVMCPTIYNRSWTDSNDTYLRALGKDLDPDIQVMWTGNAVVADIDLETMQWINSRIGRNAYIWWNYPVSDYVRERILLGPVYGNGTDIAPLLSGFVSNPMEHAEASKIALYGVADYTWNMKAYRPYENWLQATHEVLPAHTDALRTFALYNKDLGQNGHGYRRAEGDEMTVEAQRALQGDIVAIESLADRCTTLRQACDTLLADATNPALARELRPWLLYTQCLADYGTAVCNMAKMTVKEKTANAATQAQTDAFTQAHAQARKALNAMQQMQPPKVRHALQPGIRVGTRVLLPTLNDMFTLATTEGNRRYHTQLDSIAMDAPYKLSSTVEQLASQPVTMVGDNVSVADANEVIHWAPNASLTLATDRNVIFSAFGLDVQVPHVASAFKLQLFTNGQWREVPLTQSSEAPYTLNAPTIGSAKASRIKLTNVSGQQVDVFFKNFNLSAQ